MGRYERHNKTRQRSANGTPTGGASGEPFGERHDDVALQVEDEEHRPEARLRVYSGKRTSDLP